MHNEVLRVRIPDTLDKFLVKTAHKKNMTKSELVRCILTFHYYGTEMNSKNFRLISMSDRDRKNIIKVVNTVI